MDTSNLYEMIETAVAIEAKEAFLATYLDERAKARGHALDAQARSEALELFEGYIRSVPELLSAAESSSRGTPVEAIMTQVISAAVAYWDEPDDLVPDELGVLGLLDDAYFTLSMLQQVSARLESESGHKLVAEDLSALDKVVRDILGTELADILDDFVALSLSNAPVDELISAVEEHSGTFQTPRARTPFTGRSIEDLVEAHLSFASYGRRVSDSLREQLIDALEGLAHTYEDGVATLDALRGEGFAEALSTVENHVQQGLEIEDVEAVVNLLVGGLVQRVVVLGLSVDRDFIAHSVDLILDGAGWSPPQPAEPALPSVTPA